MSKLRLAVMAILVFPLVGCVSVTAPERVSVNSSPGSRRVNTANVPPVSSMEEARARLGEAYDRINYLERKNRELEHDNDKLENERDKYKDRYKDLEDRYDD